jgi:hypothetical protein
MAPNYRLQMSQTMGSLDKNSPCRICCGKNQRLNIRHIHLSTCFYNKQMTLQGNMTPMCHFCDTAHTIDHRTRQNVILSSSTLSGVPYMVGWGWGDHTPTHCDMETIPGGKIITLKKAWERAYCSNPLAIDTVIVAGLNDVRDLTRLYKDNHNMDQLAELVSEDIIHAYESLHKVVMDHSKQYDVDDTLAVATILHVPAMYWKEDDGEFPTEDYFNLKEVIDKTNLKIQAFNLKIGRSNSPKLHQAGERGKKGKRIYMWDAWREDSKQDMMHLKDPHRFNMIRLIMTYFEKGTPRSYQHLD